MSFLGIGKKSGGNNNAATLQLIQELNRQNNIQSGTSAIDNIFGKQFDEPFYANRRQAALDYYNPQLESQYADARKQLQFDLARSGGLDSSAAAQREAELSRKYGAGKQQIADQALSYETGARNNIENARAQLIQMLSSTGDAQGAVNSAQARLSSLSTPDSYSPLGDLFSTGASVLGQNIAQNNAANLAKSLGGVSLYSTGGQVRNS